MTKQNLVLPDGFSTIVPVRSHVAADLENLVETLATTATPIVVEVGACLSCIGDFGAGYEPESVEASRAEARQAGKIYDAIRSNPSLKMFAYRGGCGTQPVFRPTLPGTLIMLPEIHGSASKIICVETEGGLDLDEHASLDKVAETLRKEYSNSNSLQIANALRLRQRNPSSIIADGMKEVYKELRMEYKK